MALRRVWKTYHGPAGPVHALRGIDLTIGQGEFVAIMGPSGSGKSTLMHILGCLDVPSRGEYVFRGRPVHGMSHAELAAVRNREIGFVFQNFHLLPRLSALRNVELPMVYAGVDRRSRRARALALLKEMGLADRADHLPSELSGGQRQRVAIARALANRPSLILADEPTGALDSATGRDVLQLLASLNREGVTLVIITHDEQVGRMAPRMVRLLDGRVVSDERQVQGG